MNTNRREFIRQACTLAGGFAIASSIPSCFFNNEDESDLPFRISLAQWSLHKSLFSGKINNLDFPVVAKQQFRIDAVEYVNQFFMDKAKDSAYLAQLKSVCEDNGVKSLLIMVDQEGPLSDKDSGLRQKAVENHFKWIEAAKTLDCQSIRVNLHGDSNAEEWKKASVESLNKLAEFAGKLQMNILAENHGSHSSDASLLVEVMNEVNRPNCKTLVDFANFCVRREKGDLWESPCVEWYDRYKGVQELLPFAGGVSAKSFDFDEAGNETNTDFTKMLKLVKESGYSGYVSVEYEGSTLSEEEGIKASKALLEKIRSDLSKG